jgi:hypothetical protein
MTLSAREARRPLEVRPGSPQRPSIVSKAAGSGGPLRPGIIAKAAGPGGPSRRGALKRSWIIAKAALLAVVMAAGAAACSGVFGAQYEYEEDLYVSLDGSATIVVNASIPALIALRGVPLDPDPSARPDEAKIRAAYESPGTKVARVSPPWRRKGRQFVQVRVEARDITKLSEVGPLSWSRYQLAPRGAHHVFEQTVGASALRPGTLRKVGWTGEELVGFRLHLPSRIVWHNARHPDTNEPREVARGNILAWEQHLADRLDGVPLEIKVEMDSQSILHRTLWLFGGAFAAALAVMAFLIWFTMRKGAREAATTATGL